jgi:hypothetical protein
MFRWTVKSSVLVVALLFARNEPGNAASNRYSIQFKGQLKISNDLKLTGGQSTSSVKFMCETAWKPAEGSALHLFINHSPDMDGRRSFLSISLNYGILRSLWLDENNQSTTEVVVPIPPAMLRPENEIVFSVSQFPGSRRSGEIWTTIQPSSFIEIEYEETRPVLDLRLLPSPLLDSHSYRPKQLSVLMPEHPSSQTLEATALLIASYAGDLGEAVKVQPVESTDVASGPLLIVGTFDEQPVRLMETWIGEKRQHLFGANEGIISLVFRSARNFSPTLLVTGRTPTAVVRGVHKLIEGHFESAGTFARVSQDEIAAPVSPREWKGFLPPSNHFTLAELGLHDLKLDPQNGFSVSIPLLATPDTRFFDYGHQMALAFRFGSNVTTEQATLDIDLNGSSLRRFAAADFSTGLTATLRMKIPAQLLRRQNVLTVTWHGLDGAVIPNPAVWLLPTSEFDLPHDYESALPDLGLLQYAFFPFGLRSDFSDNVIVLPDHGGADLFASLFEFAGLLGRFIPSHRFAFAVKRSSEMNRDTQLDAHLIAFRIDSLPKGVIAAVQEHVSSSHTQKYVFSLTSSSPAALHTAINSVFSEGTLKQLRGDTAYIYPDKVASFKTTSVRQSYEYSYSNHLQAWLRENWIALPLILTAISCLLFVGLRLALAQYKNGK